MCLKIPSEIWVSFRCLFLLVLTHGVLSWFFVSLVVWLLTPITLVVAFWSLGWVDCLQKVLQLLHYLSFPPLFRLCVPEGINFHEARSKFITFQRFSSHSLLPSSSLPSFSFSYTALPTTKVALFIFLTSMLYPKVKISK